jgi:hypothetical protein
MGIELSRIVNLFFVFRDCSWPFTSTPVSPSAKSPKAPTNIGFAKKPLMFFLAMWLSKILTLPGDLPSYREFLIICPFFLYGDTSKSRP